MCGPNLLVSIFKRLKLTHRVLFLFLSLFYCLQRSQKALVLPALSPSCPALLLKGRLVPGAPPFATAFLLVSRNNVQKRGENSHKFRHADA